ncbi:PHD-finger [Trichuris suis]|nr:PHD-finger [Trichuris suis]
MMNANGSAQAGRSEDNAVGSDAAPNMEIVSQLLTVIASIKYHRQQVSLERLKSKSRILGLNSSVVEKQLELAVKHGLILKLLGVNGLWSYADPSNVNIGRFRTLQVDEKTDLARIVQRVVRDIDNCNGSNLSEIEVYVRDYYDMRVKGDLSLCQLLRGAVSKAVDQGLLVAVGGDRYQLPYKGATSSTSNGAKQSSSMSKKKSGTTLTRCYLCKGTKRWNQDGLSEGLLTCCSCHKRAHPSCLHLTPELADRLFATSSWHCSTCKVCTLCGKPVYATSLRCDGCDKGYHKACLSSVIKEKADSNKAGGFWFCPACKADRDKVREKKIVREAARNVKSRYKKSRGRPFAGKREEAEQSATMTPSFFGDLDRDEGKGAVGAVDCLNDNLPQTYAPADRRELGTTFAQPDLSACPPFVAEKDNSVPRVCAEVNVTKDNWSAPTLQPFDDAAKLSSPEQWSARLRPRLPPENGLDAHSSASNGPKANERRRRRGRLNRTCKSLTFQPLAARGRYVRKSYRQPKLASFEDLVTKEDEVLFKECQRKASHNFSLCKLDVKLPYPRAIVIGKWVIDSWYSAPYPQEYARLNKLYVCEFCLKYMKSNDVLTRHIKKCKLFHPPGDEIYRKDSLSFFEVDGCKAKIYCQNLCLLAKVYLDHKTLYYDVEPFLFYVLTMNDAYGCHLVGYFSKEKYSSQKFNVSCIVTLPPYQNKGFGRLQIAFSYLLSRKEGEVGTPEKPLSELGKFSYTSYWKSAIFEFFDKNRDIKACNIKQISETTGMTPVDIVETMQSLNMIILQDNSLKFVIDWDAIDSYMDRARNDPKRVYLDEQQLRWLPHVTSLRYRSLQSLLACSLPKEEEATASADSPSQLLRQGDHSNVSAEASADHVVPPCSSEPATQNGPPSLKKEEQEANQTNATPTPTPKKGGRRRKRRRGKIRAGVQSRDLTLESFDSDSDSSHVRTRARKRQSCHESVRHRGFAGSSADSSDSSKQTGPAKKADGTTSSRLSEAQASSSANSPSKSTNKSRGSSSQCRVAKARQEQGSVYGDDNHSDDRRCPPTLNSNSFRSTKGKFSSLNDGDDVRGFPNEVPPLEGNSMVGDDRFARSGESSPQPVSSSESTNDIEPPPRSNTAGEDSEVDTDTEIQQLTIGSVEKMTEDEPPKLLPMTMDCLPSSPGDSMPKLCRAVDTSYGTSSPEVGLEAKKKQANFTQRERRQSTCSSVKSAVSSLQGESDVPPDLQQMTPSKADTPVDVADTVKVVETRCKSNIVASPSLTTDTTPQQQPSMTYENGPLNQTATAATEYSRHAYSAVPLKPRHQSVPSLKEKQSSEVSPLVCTVRRASDSKQNSVVQSSPGASLSPYAVNSVSQMSFTGGVVSPAEFSPNQIGQAPPPPPHIASAAAAVVRDGADGVDSSQRFSGYAVGQSLPPKQNELVSSQSISTDCCFGRSVPPSSITYDNFNKLCHYADPIGQPYGISSSFTGLASAVPMNNAHSAATFVNNVASTRGYAQPFTSGGQSGAAMAQYPSQATCCYYRPKNSSCLSQPAADILPALNSNFYMNAAYMQPTAAAAAAMFGSPAGYFQSNSAAAAAFMASNHHHTQSMQMSMMGFPQGNFQDGSPTATPSNTLYYNYLTPAMMSGMRR